jgi:hypothetical protein
MHLLMERKTTIIIGVIAGVLLLAGTTAAVVIVRRNAMEMAGASLGSGTVGSVQPQGSANTAASMPQPTRVVPSYEASRSATPKPPPPGIAPVDPKTFVDTDGDGLSNAEEAKLGTDPNKADTDGDGTMDGDEVNAYHTDPLKANPPPAR